MRDIYQHLGTILWDRPSEFYQKNPTKPTHSSVFSRKNTSHSTAYQHGQEARKVGGNFCSNKQSVNWKAQSIELPTFLVIPMLPPQTERGKDFNNPETLSFSLTTGHRQLFLLPHSEICIQKEILEKKQYKSEGVQITMRALEGLCLTALWGHAESFRMAYTYAKSINTVRRQSDHSDCVRMHN